MSLADEEFSTPEDLETEAFLKYRFAYKTHNLIISSSLTAEAYSPDRACGLRAAPSVHWPHVLPTGNVP